MRKALLLFLLGLALAVPVSAQQGNTTTIRFAGAPTGGCAPLSFGINSATGDLYDCVAGAWAKVGTGGGGGTPGGSTGEVQTNAGGGSFGAITGVTNGLLANCDNFGDHCLFHVNQPAVVMGVYTNTYCINGAGAPANTYACAWLYSDASYNIQTFDGTTNGSQLTLGAASVSLLATPGGYGFSASVANKAGTITRLTFDSSGTLPAIAGAHALGSGWGSTASVTGAGGSDNNFYFEVTTGGAGIAANPTDVYTYVQGDFNSGSSSTVPYICSQSGGNDTIADITVARGQTAVTLTWHGTPTTGKTYEITCIGIQRN